MPTVTIAPRPTLALRPGGRDPPHRRGADPGGRVIEGAAVAWSSTDSTVARVDRATGRVVALSPGRAQIVAANVAGRDSVVITVRRPGVRTPVVAAITIAAPSPIRSGDSTWLHAVALGSQDDTLTGAEITWASNTPQIATVDALTGVAHGHTPGTAILLASSGGQSSVAELRVLPHAVAAMQVLGGRPMAVQESLALHVVARESDGAGADRHPGPVDQQQFDRGRGGGEHGHGRRTHARQREDHRQRGQGLGFDPAHRAAAAGAARIPARERGSRSRNPAAA